MLNSHDQTRDSRQMDKAIIDMATRSWSPSIQSLLVTLLNEANKEVRAAHDSTAGKALKSSEAFENSLDVRYEDGQRLSDVVDETDAMGSDSGIADDAMLAAQLAHSEQHGHRPTRERSAPDFLLLDPEYEGIYTQDEKRKRDIESSDVSPDSSNSADPDPDFIKEDEPESSATDSSEGFDPLGRNDSSRQELLEEEGGEMLLHSRTQKQLRETFSKLTRKKQENVDQDLIVLRQLLSLSPERLYTAEDLKRQRDARACTSTTLSSPFWTK